MVFYSGRVGWQKPQFPVATAWSGWKIKRKKRVFRPSTIVGAFSRPVSVSLDSLVKNAALHRDSTKDSLVEKSRLLLKENPSLLQFNRTPLAKELLRRSNEVFKESQLLRAFIRLKLFDGKLLFAEFSPRHAVEEQVLYFFTQRFPTFAVALFSAERKKLFFASFGRSGKVVGFSNCQNSGEKALEESRRLARDLPITGGDFFQGEEPAELGREWRDYCQAQTISSRDNPRLAKQMMPRKVLEAAHAGYELGEIYGRRSEGIAKLADFCAEEKA